MMPDSGVPDRVTGSKQRHGGDRADARQHADQRADEDADEAVEQVDRLQRDGEALAEAGEDVHGPAPLPDDAGKEARR